MGVSIEQYRAAIGLHHHTGESRTLSDNHSDSLSERNSLSSHSDISVSLSSYYSVCQQSFQIVSGPWKFHCATMLILTLSTIMAASCHDCLLIRSGIESNPGPQSKNLEKINTILALLCANAPEMEAGTKGHSKYAIRDCIRKYDPSISPHTDKGNIKQSKNFQMIDRNVLLKTIEYLNGSDMTDYTKPACINEVITKIDHLLPHSCQMCHDEFELGQGITSLLDCDRCGRGIHRDCLLKHIKHPAADDNSLEVTKADIINQINPLSLPGWRYLCKACDTLVIPSKETGKYKRLKNTDKTDDKQNSFQAGQSATSTSDSTNTNPPTNEIDPSTPDTGSSEVDIAELDLPPVMNRFDLHPPPALVNAITGSPCKTKSAHQEINSTHQHPIENRQKPNAPICRFYLKNICKHGISGKGIPGEQCKFSHPRRCAKFTKHGTLQGGCKKGKLCKDFHPPMCRDSMKSKLCTNMQCKFTHLKGTKRYESATYQQSNDTHEQFEQPDTPDTPNTGHHNNNDHAHFLGVLNNLKQELFQMMDQKLANYGPPHTVIPPPHIQHTLYPQTAPLQNQTHHQLQFKPSMPLYHTPHIRYSNPQSAH